MKSHIMPLLIPGGGAYVDVSVQTQTPSRRGDPIAKPIGFWQKRERVEAFLFYLSAPSLAT